MSTTLERLYLDACVINRSGDDQRQPRIHEEAVAIERILDLVKARTVEWIGSSILQLELSRNPNAIRRSQALLLLSFATTWITPDPAIISRSLLLRTHGYGELDALHLALAEASGATCLLTVDDRFVQRAGRRGPNGTPTVENPVNWLRRRHLWLLKP